MFKVGDLVQYKNDTGKVIFACESSISILIGDELPKATQTRLVVYCYDWPEVKLIQDTSQGVHFCGTGDQNRVLLTSRQEFTQK